MTSKRLKMPLKQQKKTAHAVIVPEQVCFMPEKGLEMPKPVTSVFREFEFEVFYPHRIAVLESQFSEDIDASLPDYVVVQISY